MWTRRLDVRPRLGLIVGRLLPAAEDPQNLTRLIELDDHVGAFVDRPDVVVLVDTHRVGERPAVEALADFPDELAPGAELEQLRCRGRVGRTVGAVRAGEHEYVPPGIHSHARDLAEIEPRGKLEELRNGFEGDGRHALLCERRRGQHDQQREKTGFHRALRGDYPGHGGVDPSRPAWIAPEASTPPPGSLLSGHRVRVPRRRE